MDFIDFQIPIALKGYQIKAGNSYWISSWVLSVCNDGSSWKEVDSHDQIPGDTIYYLSKTENIRYVKIDGRSTSSPNTYFEIYHVKFFGSLSIKRSKNGCSCKGKNVIDKNLLGLILIHLS